MITKSQITFASLTFALALVPAGGRLRQAEEDPAVRLERAVQLETVDGDLEAAIEQYQEIIAENGNQRAIAAEAMLRLGGCFEKLGQKEAMSVYERLVKEYPDQSQQAEAARWRLAQLSVASPEKKPTFRKIEIPGRPDNAVFSPDGSRLAFFADGGLWIAPARGNVSPNIAGEPARIADVPGGWALGNLLSWSWNGEWIAVNGELEGEESAFIIPVKGGERKRVPMPPRGGHAQSYRLSLSPNGEQLAFSALELGLRDSDRLIDRYIYTVPTEGGAPNRLTFEWSRLPAWSPDGKYVAYVGYREREDWSEDSERSRYHGDLWIVPSEGGTPVRLQTAVGRLRGPVWSPDGQWIAIHHEPGRGNDSREIWVVPALPDAAGKRDPIKITLSRSTYLMLAGWTPQDQIGFFMETDMHSALYTVTSSGGKAVQVSPQGWAWYPRWSRDGERIYHRMVARPEEGQPYWLFQVPSAGGSPTGIPVESERRLTVMIPGGGFDLSPDGQSIVVSGAQEPYREEEGLDLWVVPISGGPPKRLTHAPTTIEHHPCWSPDGRWIAFTRFSGEDEPATIYIIPSEGGEAVPILTAGDSVGFGGIAFSPDGQQIAFFSDQAIKAITVQGGPSQTLVSEITHGRHSELAYSPSGDRIAFTTGRPYEGDARIMVAELATGLATELQTGLPSDTMYHGFSWSPDGGKIAFVGYSGGKDEFWVVSDFLPE